MRVGLPFFVCDVVFMFVHMKNHVIKMDFNLFVCAYNSGTKTVNDQTYKYIPNLNHTAHMHTYGIRGVKRKSGVRAILTFLLLIIGYSRVCVIVSVCLTGAEARRSRRRKSYVPWLRNERHETKIRRRENVEKTAAQLRLAPKVVPGNGPLTHFSEVIFIIFIFQ